jgi:membrane-associated phospholipid phosphatase
VKAGRRIGDLCRRHSADPRKEVMTKPLRPVQAFSLLLFALLAGCGGSNELPSTASVGIDEPGAWPTWVLPSAASITVQPPPRAGSAAAQAELSELRGLGQSRATSAAARPSSAEPATAPWTELSLALVSQTRVVDPPRASRAYALVSVAMYDAVVAASYWQAHYRRRPPHADAAAVGPAQESSYPSENAAVAGAASRVLAFLYPERPPRGLDRMADRAARAEVLAGRAFPSDAEAGLALGRAVADRVIARARRDGSARTWEGARPLGREFWQPPRPSVAPMEPAAGTWRTWVIASGSEFRPLPPPRFGSPQLVAELRELIELRRKLTPAQKRIAKFWEGGRGSPLPPGVWNDVALAYVRRDRMSTPEAARVFALLNVAMADTGVAVWDAKYAYWSARPEAAVRDLRLASGWSPFLETPPFPGFVSAHSAYSGAASAVLASLFPKDARVFRAKAVEAGLSRLDGGIHIRSDHRYGLALGSRIGRLVVERAQLQEAR